MDDEEVTWDLQFKVMDGKVDETLRDRKKRMA